MRESIQQFIDSVLQYINGVIGLFTTPLGWVVLLVAVVAGGVLMAWGRIEDKISKKLDRFGFWPSAALSGALFALGGWFLGWKDVVAYIIALVVVLACWCVVGLIFIKSNKFKWGKFFLIALFFLSMYFVVDDMAVLIKELLFSDSAPNPPHTT